MFIAQLFFYPLIATIKMVDAVHDGRDVDGPGQRLAEGRIVERRLGRTGYGIWIHGMDRRNGQRPRLDTDGCIALPNERLLALEDTFEVNVTPVIVGAALDWIDAAALVPERAILRRR